MKGQRLKKIDFENIFKCFNNTIPEKLKYLWILWFF